MKAVMKLLHVFGMCLVLLACSQGGRSQTQQPREGQQSKTISYEIPRYSVNAPKQQILHRYSYTTSYNKVTLCPNWVGWCLTADHVDGEFARKGHSFVEDLDVPRPRALYTDIREGECGYQRGHMCPAGDNKWAKEAQKDAFLMTNICPQNGDLNQRDWKYLEEQCRTWAQEYGAVYIVAGPIFYSTVYSTVGMNNVAVPDAFFKVILTFEDNTPKAIGFIYENQKGHHKMLTYAHPIDYVEKVTGLDFFYQLDDKIENEIEAVEDFSSWNITD